MNDISQDAGDLLTLTADIVAAHVGNNSVAISDLSLLINHVHAALSGLSHPAEKPEEPLVPAVSIRPSVKPDYIVCLEHGKKLQMLRRHLMPHYGMTPDRSEQPQAGNERVRPRRSRWGRDHQQSHSKE